MGLEYKECEDGICIFQKERPKAVNYIKTSVYPGFPTDMQSVTMSVAAYSDGKTVFEESIFENRFGVAGQLKRWEQTYRLIKIWLMLPAEADLPEQMLPELI